MTYAMRRFCYHASYLRRHLFPVITAPLERWLRERCALETIDGIKLCDVSQRAKVDDRFLVDTRAALQLIKSVDPRRYRRVQREIESIVNCEALVFAGYSRTNKICQIDYGRHTETGDAEWYTWYYASVLVHEATHGAIYSRQVDYTPALRVRIERLCRKEQKRFATKCDTPERHWSDALVGEFDEKDWHRSWYSPISQRFIDLVKRIRESRRSLKRDV
jgi:hypothetical protein